VREEEEQQQAELDSVRGKAIPALLLSPISEPPAYSTEHESTFLDIQSQLEDAPDISLLLDSPNDYVDTSGIDHLIEASRVVNMVEVSKEYGNKGDEMLDIERAMRSMTDPQWLNDEAMQRVLQVFETNDAHVLDPVLIEDDPSQPKRIQLHGKTIMLVPLAQNKHWTVSHVDLSQMRIEHYNSLADSGYAADAKRRLLAFLQVVTVKDSPAEGAVKLNSQLVGDWVFRSIVCASQPNFNDCGVYALVNALHLLAGITVPLKIFAPMWRVLFRVIISASHPRSGAIPMVSIADLPSAAAAERPSPSQGTEITLKDVSLAESLRRAQQINQQLEWELTQVRMQLEHLKEARGHCQAACDLLKILSTMSDIEVKKGSAERSIQESRAAEKGLQALKEHTQQQILEQYRAGIMREVEASEEAARRAMKTASAAEKKAKGRELAIRAAEDQARRFLEEYTQELETAEELYKAVSWSGKERISGR